MYPAIDIVQARPDQIEIVAEILEDAARVQREHGFPGWPVPFPRQRLRDRFAGGQLFLALIDGAAQGTFSLQPSDPLFWGQQPDDALYLHGLAIRRTASGQGIGRAMLAWAERHTTAQGRRFLRLDTLAGDRGLCRYYEQAGYTDRGTIAVPGFLARLYEKRLPELAADD